MSEHGNVSGIGQHPNPVFGTPHHDITLWDGQQRLPDDCAIKCQQFILEQFTGQHWDENAMVREAFDHGWYEPGKGTPSAAVGNLLELHGVAVHRYEHASQFHLAQELAQGHKVIVGVDSAKLWFNAAGIPVADHAVVVSGIDTHDPLHVNVLISDPGTGQALGNVPLEQFLDAWHGSDFSMVATCEPAPAHLPEMAHFDYDLGHIPTVAGLAYDVFLTYAHHLDALIEVVHHYVETHPLFQVDHALFGEHLAHLAIDNVSDLHPADFDPHGHMDSHHHDNLADPYHLDQPADLSDCAGNFPDDSMPQDVA
jgi:hypothetical protein